MPPNLDPDLGLALPAPSVRLLPLHPAVPQGQASTMPVLLSVSAPPLTPRQTQGLQAQRAPIALALVVDESGSMHEALPALRSFLGALLDHLRMDDMVALIGFDHRVREYQPMRPLGDGLWHRDALAQLDSYRGTDLMLGWTHGIAAMKGVPPGFQRRVLMLSDGAPTAGYEPPDAQQRQERYRRAGAAAWARGIRTSTVGLGHAFAESLMLAMAQGGHGRCHFVPRPSAYPQVLAAELESIEGLALRDAQAVLRPAPGMSLRVLGEAPASNGAWPLPPLAYGSTVRLLAQLDLPAHNTLTGLDPLGLPWPVLTASVSGQDSLGHPLTVTASPLTLPRQAAATLRDLPPDATVRAALEEQALAEELGQLQTGPVASRTLDPRRLHSLLGRLPHDSVHRGWLTALAARATDFDDMEEMNMLWKETVFAGVALREGRRPAERG